jgi:hypothetical protein
MLADIGLQLVSLVYNMHTFQALIIIFQPWVHRERTETRDTLFTILFV